MTYETVDRIRNSHRHAKPNPAENPAWANCHMDCGILLAEIEHLKAYQLQMNEILKENAALRNDLTAIGLERDRLRATLERIDAHLEVRPDSELGHLQVTGGYGNSISFWLALKAAREELRSEPPRNEPEAPRLGMAYMDAVLDACAATGKKVMIQLGERVGGPELCKHDDGQCHADDPCDTCPVHRPSQKSGDGQCTCWIVSSGPNCPVHDRQNSPREGLASAGSSAAVNPRESLVETPSPSGDSTVTKISCIYREGCRKFPACTIEARCCGRDASIPATR